MMRTNTKKFKLLQFMGEHKGLRYSEIERFICEMNGYNYDQKVPVRQWNGKYVQIKFAMVRRHKGIWATNLTSGKDCILHKYCVKNENKRWILNEETQKFIDSLKAPVKSSLEKVSGDDTIKGNSVTVSANRIQFPFNQEKPAQQGPVINALTPKPAASTAIDLVAKLQALQKTHAELYESMKILQQVIGKNDAEQEALKNSICNILKI